MRTKRVICAGLNTHVSVRSAVQDGVPNINEYSVATGPCCCALRDDMIVTGVTW